MGVAAPRLAPQFGFDARQMGWVFSISNIGLVIGASFGGWLADKSGRKPVLIGAVAVFGCFTLATALAGGYQALLAVRFCAGLGFGAALPNLMAIASEISRPEQGGIDGGDHVLWHARRWRAGGAHDPTTAAGLRLAHAVFSRRRAARLARPRAPLADARNTGARFGDSHRAYTGVAHAFRRRARRADAAALARLSPDPADPLSIPELAADPGHRQGARRRGGAPRFDGIQLRQRCRGIVVRRAGGPISLSLAADAGIPGADRDTGAAGRCRAAMAWSSC